MRRTFSSWFSGSMRSYKFLGVLLLLFFFSGNAYAQPSNDLCEDAIDISSDFGGSVCGDDASASNDPDDGDETPCYDSDSEVWYSFSGVSSIKLRITSWCGNTYVPTVTLYKGACGGGLTPLACRDYVADDSLLQHGGLDTNQTYFVSVGNNVIDCSGSFCFDLSELSDTGQCIGNAKEIDDCGTAFSITTNDYDPCYATYCGDDDIACGSKNNGDILTSNYDGMCGSDCGTCPSGGGGSFNGTGCDMDGSTENNAFWSFTTNETCDYDITFDISNCSDGNGVQYAIYQYDGDSITAYHAHDGGGNIGTVTETITATTNGEVIIMVDGFSGDVCKTEITVDPVNCSGCTVTDSCAGQPSGITVSIDSATCVGGDGAVSIDSVHGGTAPYEYNFDSTGYSSDTNYTSLDSGSYNVRVRDADSCVYDTTVYVPADTVSPNASISGVDTLTCTTTSVTLDGSSSTSNSGNIDYNWSTGATTASITVNNAGSYTLTVTDPDNGCTDDTTVTVPIDTVAPEAEITGNDTLTCSTTSVTLDGSSSTSNSGNIDYNWSTGATTASITVNSAGNYTLTVTDPDNGCTDDTTVTVPIDTASPEAHIAEPDTLTCAVDSVTLDGSASTSKSGNLSYSWSNGDTGPSTKVGSASSFTLTVTDSDNGCTDDTTVTVEIDTAFPSASIASPDTFTCSTDSLQLDASASSTNSGNKDYSWSALTGTVLSGANTAMPYVGSAGDYELTLTDPANGCVDKDTVTVPADNNLPTVNVAPLDTLDCKNSVSRIDASASTSSSGNKDYSWSTSGGNIIGAAADSSWIDVDVAASYKVTVTDPSNGCSSSSTETVPLDTSSPDAVIAAPDTLTCSATSVTLDASVSSSSSGNKDYSWSTSGGNIVNAAPDSSTVDVDVDASYTVTVTDTNNGCTDDTTVSVAIDTISPNAAIADPDTLTCSVDSVLLDGSGSSASSGSLDYNWSFGPSDDSVHVFNDGNYTLTVTDPDNGCSDDSTVAVEIDTLSPNASVAAADTLTCTKDTVTLDATGSSSSSGLVDHSWSTSGGNIVAAAPDSSTVDVTLAASYTVTVTDSKNGCTDDTTVSVPIDTLAPTAAIAKPDSITCSVDSVLLDGNNSTASSGSLGYDWSTGASTDSIKVDSGGAYTLTVIDSGNGCTDDSSVTVPVDTASPLINIAPPDTFSCTTDSVIIDATASSTNSGGASFSWSSITGTINVGANTDTPEVGAAGDYALTLTDTVNGCSSTDTVMVPADNKLPTVQVDPLDTITCADPVIRIDASASSTNSGNKAFSWSSSGGNIANAAADSAWVDVDLATSYTVTVTDSANGCSNSSSVNVPIDTMSPDASIFAPAQLTCENDTVTLDASASTSNDGSPGYSWTTSGGKIVDTAPDSSMVQVVQGGDYTVTVTDTSNGCIDDSTVTVPMDTASPTPIVAQPDTFFCNTDSLLLDATASSSNSGNKDYQWSTPDGSILNGGSTSTPTIGSPGAYVLTLTDPVNGCVNSDTVEVPEDPNSPLALFQPDPSEGERPLEVKFNDKSKNADSYSWDFGDGDTSDAQSPTHTYEEEGRYTVRLFVRNDSGCTDSSSYRYIVVDQPIKFEVPNVFSPNGDGKNDLFKVKAQGIRSLNARIYNRWGEMIYKWQGPDKGWNGQTSGGDDVSEGTYYYTIKAVDKDGKERKRQGSVTVVR